MYIKYRVGFCAIFFVKDQRGAEDNGSKSESLFGVLDIMVFT
jgi:hypothetical protein